ncbi:hypothetical protein [Catenulispora rubra]|uniref:hypothetical protein n=1 Tax=Catenulispora rubra TaxID=280293 RepID=UPI0018923D2F|nr:hypothetical protein [Catenulispora rubra]
MLARTRRVPTLAAALALGLATAAGAAAATAPPTTATGPTSPNPTLAAIQSTLLPNGDRVLVSGSGPAATVVVQSPDGRTVPAVRYAPDPHHTYVIPDSVLAHPAQLTQYQIPALSSAAAPAATPHYPLDILQVNALGLDGKPTDASTFLTNTDDVTKFNQPIPVAGGLGRVAVPVGHYSAVTIFADYNTTTQISTLHIVTQLDVTVAAGGVSTLNADERTATAQTAMTTPKTAVADFSDQNFSRTDANGVSATLGVLDNGGPIFLSPTGAAQVGKFTFQLQAWGGESPAGTKGDPYRYDAMFPVTDHVDANQTYAVDGSKLTTMHNAVDTDAGESARQGEFMMGAYSPETGGFQIGHVIPVPEHLTTYIGQPVGDQSWLGDFITSLPGPTTGFPGALLLGQDGPLYQGKTEVWRTWGHGPLTAQVGQYKDVTGCRACADGGTVDLSLNPVVDGNPDTDVQLFGPATGHLSIYRDGSQVFSQDNTSGAELTGQAQTAGKYRMVFDLDLSQFPITQSTATHTDVTVPYTPTPDPKWTLPSGDFCQAQGTGTTPCSVLPVINLNYQLATDATNSTHGPLAALLLTVGHQSYNAAGSNAAATCATVSVSYDKGATWTPASVIPAGQNHFVALWKNGAKGSTPWLKVTATDALGGSITQTVANAYTIG